MTDNLTISKLSSSKIDVDLAQMQASLLRWYSKKSTGSWHVWIAGEKDNVNVRVKMTNQGTYKVRVKSVDWGWARMYTSEQPPSLETLLESAHKIKVPGLVQLGKSDCYNKNVL
jgi:hypothetical protein